MSQTKTSIPTRTIRDIVNSGFNSMSETIPLPIGFWNMARGYVLSGLQAWQLTQEKAYHWGTFPMMAQAFQDASWNQRFFLATLAGAVATSQHYAALPIAPAPNALPEEIWLDHIALASGPGKPDPRLRSTGLGTFGYSEIENNPDAHHLALSLDHGKALTSIAASVLADAGDRPPRYLKRVLELDLPHHLLPQLRPWGVNAILIQVEQGGLYVSLLNESSRSMAAAWWRADSTSSQRIPLTFTPASWILLHPIFASVWHDLKADGIILEQKLNHHIFNNPTKENLRKFSCLQCASLQKHSGEVLLIDIY